MSEIGDFFTKVQRRTRKAFKDGLALGEWGLESVGICNREYVLQLRGIKNVYRGRSAFLIGNGPSVNPVELEKLKGVLSVCCNRFHLAYDLTSFRPTFTIATDEQTIGDFGSEIVSQSESQVILSLIKKPSLAGEYIFVKQRNHQVGFSKNLFFPPFACGASLILATQVAYWMGIRRFYLYGVDHHYTFESTGSPDIYYSANGEGNHFIRDYRGGKNWCPPQVEIIEAGWKLADKILRREGGFIKNATTGGRLDVVERISFEKALLDYCEGTRKADQLAGGRWPH